MVSLYWPKGLSVTLPGSSRRAGNGDHHVGTRHRAVVGVAGAGKTTALAAVREAFEAEGFEVIGTSMSGRPSGPTRWKTVEAGSWRT
jgi:hypothetical protein